MFVRYIDLVAMNNVIRNDRIRISSGLLCIRMFCAEQIINTIQEKLKSKLMF